LHKFYIRIMKNINKIVAILLLILATANIYAQKFAHINSSELLAAMPESDSAQAKIEKLAANYQQQLEEMQVEMNKKYDDYLNNRDSYTDLIRQTKESEISDLQERIQQFQNVASQELQNKRTEMLKPIIDKANSAIKSIAEANNFIYVFDISQGNPIYFSDQSVDIMTMVKEKLGLK
jgi:outer membrane protein